MYKFTDYVKEKLKINKSWLLLCVCATSIFNQQRQIQDFWRGNLV